MSQTHGYPRYDDDNEDYDEPQPEYQVQYDNEKKTRRFPVKDGKATAQYPNYDRYEGQFVGAKRNGVGKYIWGVKDETSVQATYTGEYRDGKRHGKGTMIYPDGSKYVGEWKDGLRHGHGLYIYPNGDKYCGGWEKGVRSGVGTYIYASSQTQLTGHWIRGTCTKAKWSYYDAELDQHFLPFVADVDLQKGKVVKYLPSEELRPKAIATETTQE